MGKLTDILNGSANVEQITKRDLFAAAALVGLLANSNPDLENVGFETGAHLAYQFADCMVAESAKPSRAPTPTTNED